MQNLVATSLNGLAMPEGVPNAVAYVAPPVVEDMAAQPLIFVWGGKLSEKRQTMAGGRSTAINTTSGFRTLDWEIDVYIKYAMANDNANIQSLFPLVIDMVMQKLRGITMPQKITDAITGWPSQVVLIGESFELHYGDIHQLADQRFWLFEAQIICPVREQIQQ